MDGFNTCCCYSNKKIAINEEKISQVISFDEKLILKLIAIIASYLTIKRAHLACSEGGALAAQHTENLLVSTVVTL
jgi:hypothetical protein